MHYELSSFPLNWVSFLRVNAFIEISIVHEIWRDCRNERRRAATLNSCRVFVDPNSLKPITTGFPTSTPSRVRR